MRWLILLVLVSCLIGCGASQEFIKWDQQAYEEGKALATQWTTTWSYNSGFIACSGAVDIAKFPIQSITDIKLSQSTQLSMAVAQMDEIVRRLGKWKDEDYDLGCTMGLRAYAAGIVVIDAIRLGMTVGR